MSGTLLLHGLMPTRLYIHLASLHINHQQSLTTPLSPAKTPTQRHTLLKQIAITTMDAEYDPKDGCSRLL